VNQKPKLLFLTQLLPWPLIGGGQIKSFHTLKALSESYEIKLLAFVRAPEEREHEAALAEFCTLGIETVFLRRSKLRDLKAAAQALIKRESFLILRDFTIEMHEAVARELESSSYAAIHTDHLQMMQFVPKFLPKTKVILDQHNVEYRIPKRLSETIESVPKRKFAQLEWKRLREFEKASVRRADLTLAVSEEDKTELCGLIAPSSGRIEAVPIGVDLEYFVPIEFQASSRELLSIGTMFWPPNVDALLYFCASILPKIRKSVPDVVVNIVGARPVAEIRALASDPKIFVTGAVPDVREHAASCGVFIVPLRSGSGMRVKILNALAMGLPTVSTTVGAEGIAVRDTEHLLLADTPEAFAAAVVRLLSDRELALQLGKNGRRLMETHYGWDAVGTQLRKIYAEALA
jgi:polysaccharide biosynthesis protein PslH